MSEHVASYQGIEVLGHPLLTVTNALGSHSHIVQSLLGKRGIHRIRGDDWYPLEHFIAALNIVASEVGENTMFEMGKKIYEYAAWPSHITDIDGALASVNVAYHMNHRDAAGPLYDAASGALRSPIGGYAYSRTGPRSGVMVSSTPYLSEFDRGIIVGVARRWRPLAAAVLDPSAPTRKSGGSSCTFLITW